jgi:hypothetical protein
MDEYSTYGLSEVGIELVNQCLHVPFSARRGVLDELFPYLHFASKRMSARAISRWLESGKGIKLSDVTISKALRKPEKGWEAFWDDIEPFARTFCDAHSACLCEVLFKENLFDALNEAAPSLEVSDDPESPHVAHEQYQEAAGVLRTRWFSMPAEVRILGQAFIEPFAKACDAEEIEETEKAQV